MPLKGDFDKLQSLQRGLLIAGQEGAQKCAEKASEEALKLARGQVRRAEAPDGTPWAPPVVHMTQREALRQQRTAQRRGLTRSGPLLPLGEEDQQGARAKKALRGVGDDATAAADGSTAHIELPHKGARFSNTGTRHQVQRQIVPIAGQPMPGRWRSRILSRTTFIIWRLIKQRAHPQEGGGATDS